MPIDLRISELLEELHDSGRTPEEVCGDDPELLPELRERWRQIRRLEADLETLFPPERSAAETEPAEPAPGLSLPRIEGYDIEAILGRGGMGVVLRARHLRLNRIVALKLALVGSFAEARDRERFQREAEAVAALRHSHVVRVYDIGESEGRPYYTMELVEGGSLAERPAPIEPRAAAALLLPLTGAVGAAHAAGIIHRDLKPANVFLERDGTPKIGDFGLSRRLDDATGLTLHGTILGTPSYMAPEQADGDPARAGPPADIYALGAILYELLTGVPPFRGSTPAETIRQLLSTDPVPPTRRAPGTPRDLATICLKCLERDPARRYSSANALGDDLCRFLAGGEIAARPPHRVGRLWRRVRRRASLAVLVPCALIIPASLIGLGLWSASEQARSERRARVDAAAVEQLVESDLSEMSRHLRVGAWSAASSALARAQGRLGPRDQPDLRRVVAQGHRDLDLAVRLDQLRVERARSIAGAVSVVGADRAYAAAFREAGLGDSSEPPESAAARVRASRIRAVLIDALDDWPPPLGVPDRAEWPLRVATLADVDPSDWTRDARDPRFRQDRPALERLIHPTALRDRSVPLLIALAEDLARLKADPLPLLVQIQRQHPGDFWANFWLANMLDNAGRSAEAIRFQQAALSIRPDLGVVHNNLGSALSSSGSQADAIEYLRSALRIEPGSAITRYNLGAALRSAGRPTEAAEVLRLGLGLGTAPHETLLHAGLGEALAESHADAEAVGEFRAALALDPNLATASLGLKDALLRLGRATEALAAWRSAVRAAPHDMGVADGYAEFCLFLGATGDYEAARRVLLGRTAEPNDPQAAERAGRACLLQPGSREDLSRAAALIDLALADTGARAPDWARPYFRLAQGLAEYRLDRLDSAIAILSGDAAPVMGPCPRLIKAMALHRQGRIDDARHSLAEAVGAFDWQGTPPTNRELWIYHILRREAEATVGPPP